MGRGVAKEDSTTSNQAGQLRLFHRLCHVELGLMLAPAFGLASAFAVEIACSSLGVLNCPCMNDCVGSGGEGRDAVAKGTAQEQSMAQIRSSIVP